MHQQEFPIRQKHRKYLRINMIYSLTLSAGYQCRASPLRTYLPLPCFVVLQLDLSTFFLCQLAQYIKLCQLGHYSMNWFLFLVLVCFFLLVPASCVWDTQMRSPLCNFQWYPRDGGFLASLVRTPAGSFLLASPSLWPLSELQFRAIQRS